MNNHPESSKNYEGIETPPEDTATLQKITQESTTQDAIALNEQTDLLKKVVAERKKF
jgi:hypothetical protein